MGSDRDKDRNQGYHRMNEEGLKMSKNCNLVYEWYLTGFPFLRV